jgi:LCP family protein required for cell wall assembly
MGRNRDDRPNPLMSGGSYRTPSGNKRKGSKKNGHFGRVFAISLCIVLGIVIISGVVIYKLGHGMYSNINYVADQDVPVMETLPEEAEEETLSTEERQGIDITDEELTSIHDLLAGLDDVDVKEDDEIYNVLLIGVDRRDKTWNGNSDSMILVSINKGEDKVSMVSLMRDIYVNIPDVGYKKLNAAYAYGAGPLLCTTVTDTFRIQVDRYIAVDFFDLIDIIDCIGGVTLEVSDKEAEVANGYIIDMCNIMDVDYTEHLFDGGGTYYCDGIQAVGFARNRYVGNSDFERTQRQRYVLTQLMEEVKQMSLAQMTEKVQDVLQYVTMNIPESEIWDMLKELPDILDYTFESSRVPYDDMYDIVWVDNQDMLVPYWEDTLAKLQEQIYGSSAGE